MMTLDAAPLIEEIGFTPDLAIAGPPAPGPLEAAIGQGRAAGVLAEALPQGEIFLDLWVGARPGYRPEAGERSAQDMLASTSWRGFLILDGETGFRPPATAMA